MTGVLPIPAQAYTAVLADPPWAFENWSEAGEAKNARHQYTCLPTPEICGLRDALGLDWIMAPDCACFMWATFPMLRDAFAVMESWGFRYVSGGCWHKKTRHGKTAFGTGYVFRSACEPFLVGVRGNPPWRSRSVRNLIEAPVREHSRKPDDLHAAIEALLHPPYLELFARERRAGWTAWGNEVGKFAATAAE